MEKSLFERFLFEAPGDETPPDVAAAQGNPPDMPDDNAPTEDMTEPPDMGGDDASADDGPPDMGDDQDMGFGDEDQAEDDGTLEGDIDQDQNLGLDDKVSAIMNAGLYQRYLTLISNIASQQQMIKNNMDIIYSVSPDSLDIVKSLNTLDENIRLYLKNYFQTENYSKNLLFFNKCLNLLKLLNDSFDKAIRKGIKQAE